MNAPDLWDNPQRASALMQRMTKLRDAIAPAQELLAMRSIFLSRLVYQTYNGYVMSQFKKLESDLRTRGTIRWKHAMHLIRLLLSGVTVLREGFVPMHVQEHREHLLAVRRGEAPWEEVNAWRLRLQSAAACCWPPGQVTRFCGFPATKASILSIS